NYACMYCYSDLTNWFKGAQPNRRYKLFNQPVIWREQTNHDDDCFFCSSKIPNGLRHRGTRASITECPANLEDAKKRTPYYHFCKSALRPVPFDDDSQIL